MVTHPPLSRRALLVPLRAAVVAGAVLVTAVVPAQAAEQAARPSEEAAAALARDFMSAFAAKDMERVGSMFVPGAVVQRARLGEEAPDVAQFSATDWLVESGQAIAGVRDFRIEVLETTSLAFEGGTTVSARFRATGTVGDGIRFVNEGVDTFSLAPAGSEWRIVLYNSFEKLLFAGSD